MTPVDYFIFHFGLLLEVVVLWRGFRGRLWRYYPFFYTYLGCVFTRTLAILVFVRFSPWAYSVAYWVSESIVVFFRFLIVWEVFRETFFSTLAVRRVVGQVLTTLLLALTIVLFFASKSPGLFFADLERKSGFAQAALLIATLFLARYYAVPLGRNIWGMALGLGIYVSIAIVNFATLELVKSFFPYWRLIRPLSFIGMLGVWTWALWSYAPNPRPATAALEVYERSLAHWSEAWSEVYAALRKAVGL